MLLLYLFTCSHCTPSSRLACHAMLAGACPDGVAAEATCAALLLGGAELSWFQDDFPDACVRPPPPPCSPPCSPPPALQRPPRAPPAFGRAGTGVWTLLTECMTASLHLLVQHSGVLEPAAVDQFVKSAAYTSNQNYHSKKASDSYSSLEKKPAGREALPISNLCTGINKKVLLA